MTTLPSSHSTSSHLVHLFFTLTMAPVSSTPSQLSMFFSFPPASGAFPRSPNCISVTSGGNFLTHQNHFLQCPKSCRIPKMSYLSHLSANHLLPSCQPSPDTFIRKLPLDLLNYCSPASVLGIVFLRISVSYASLNCIYIFSQKKKKRSNIFLHFSCLILNHAILTLNR